MDLKPVNSINNNANTIRVSDGNSPIRLIFKDVKGEVINLYDKIDYFYLTKDDEKFYSVTDISYDGDEVIIRLPKLRKGNYKAEIRDKDGSIYPANEDLYILLRRSFEDDKDIYYFGHREDILNNVEPIIIQHIDKNPNKFKGERGQQGFTGREGLRGIDGSDGIDGLPGKDGIDGLPGKDGIDGLPGKDGIDGKDGVDGSPGVSLKDVFTRDQGININDLDEATRETFLELQGIDVNYILGKGNVKNENLSDGLSADKLKHITSLPKTSNILNPEEFIDNGYYRVSNGEWVVSNSYKTSGLIPINPGERFSKPGNSFVTYWSAGGSFISGHNANATFVSHTDQQIKYMRVALTAPTPYSEWMVVRGADYPTSYIPYEKEYILNPEYYTLEDVNLTDEQKNILKKLDNDDVTKIKNIDFKRINHINPKAIVNGGYYRATDGGWVIESSGRTVSSGLIETTKNDVWIKPQNSIVTFWDENGVFVSGRNTNVTFTVPDDDAISFLRTSINSNNTPFDEWMLIKGDELPERFIPYDEIELIGIGGSIDFDFDTSLISSVSPNSLNTINASAHSVPGNFTDQLTHPSIVAFETAWNGYKYWMAVTPYPYGNSFHENPCIICSNDLIDWVEPSDNVNPLDSTEDNTIFYNSDTELLMVGDTMELWWRRRNNSPHSEEFYRRTSTDGVNWTPKQLTFSQNTGAGAVSPSVIFDEGIYKMWTINGESGLISYHESETGDNFVKVHDINIGLNIWHGSIKRNDQGLYEMYASYGKRHRNYHIAYAYSDDNINWSTPEKVLNAVPERHDAELYRPTFFDMPWSGRRNKLRIIAYGVINNNNIWKIGISMTYKENPTSLRGLDFE